MTKTILTIASINDPDWDKFGDVEPMYEMPTNSREATVISLMGRPMNDNDVSNRSYHGYRDWLEECSMSRDTQVVIVPVKRIKQIAQRFGLAKLNSN